MANGTFLVSMLVCGEPSLVRFTFQPDDPVVVVEPFKPDAGDFRPRPVTVHQTGDDELNKLLTANIPGDYIQHDQ